VVYNKLNSTVRQSIPLQCWELQSRILSEGRKGNAKASLKGLVRKKASTSSKEDFVASRSDRKWDSRRAHRSHKDNIAEKGGCNSNSGGEFQEGLLPG